MFSTAERAQLRAALHLWRQAAANSKVHPSEVPACKTEFLCSGVAPLTDVQIEALIEALEGEVVYLTLAEASRRYEISTLRLKRQLDRNEAQTVPGSKLYNSSDVILAMKMIRDKNEQDFFGRPTT